MKNEIIYLAIYFVEKKNAKPAGCWYGRAGASLIRLEAEVGDEISMLFFFLPTSFRLTHQSDFFEVMKKQEVEQPHRRGRKQHAGSSMRQNFFFT